MNGYQGNVVFNSPVQRRPIRTSLTAGNDFEFSLHLIGHTLILGMVLFRSLHYPSLHPDFFSARYCSCGIDCLREFGRQG